MATGASVVIVGGGIVGCGVADQLTRLGWEDVVVLEQGPLFEAGGSTTHAPGLVFQTNPSKTMSSFASYAVERYSELELDGEPCFYPVGGLEVAATPARWRDLGRKQGLATSWGIESVLLTPEECVERSPLLDPGKIYGGFFVPSDGIAKAVRACEALARRREEGPRRRLVCLTFEDPNTMVLGNEPVWHGDEAVGYVTSAGYGYWTGKIIAYAWVPPGLSREGERVEIQYFEERHGATVAQEPLFDVTMKRMRG